MAAHRRRAAKVDLPNYGVFDEKRVFHPGPAPGPVGFRGVRLGLPICEDIWGPDVVEVLHETGAEILLSPNGSPYFRGKDDERLSVATARVVEPPPLIYLNQVGGQDELAFDGGSFVLNPDCSLGGRLPSFAETVAKVVFARETGGGAASRPLTRRFSTTTRPITPPVCSASAIMCRKTVSRRRARHVGRRRFGALRRAGGDALGPSGVHAIMLPYRYTSGELLGRRRMRWLLGLRYDILPIAAAVEGVEAALGAPVRRDGARRDRGKYPGAGARHIAHVGVE